MPVSVSVSRLSIDLRMVNASGIGTYISNIVPRVIKALPNCTFDLIGDPVELRSLDWTHSTNVRLISCCSPIYSLREQIDHVTMIAKGTDLFWSPHYNIPVLSRTKLLVTVHDVFHLSMAHYLKGFHQKIYAKLMFNILMRKATAIICPSKYTVTELIRKTGKRHSNIHVTYNAVDPAWFNVERDASPHERPYLVFVGNVKPHKNLKGLIQAFETLRDTIPHDLVIIGKKEGFITADEDTLTRVNSGRIVFTGYLKENELRRYVAHADALVLPSFYEGFGIPPLEAMACGCPVIVSACSSLPEVCGDASLYCNPYDSRDIAAKIKEVLTNERLRSLMIHKGRARAGQFTWESSAEKTAQVINGVLAN